MKEIDSYRRGKIFEKFRFLTLTQVWVNWRDFGAIKHKRHKRTDGSEHWERRQGKLASLAWEEDPVGYSRKNMKSTVKLIQSLGLRSFLGINMGS